MRKITAAFLLVSLGMATTAFATESDFSKMEVADINVNYYSRGESLPHVFVTEIKFVGGKILILPILTERLSDELIDRNDEALEKTGKGLIIDLSSCAKEGIALTNTCKYQDIEF